MWFSNIGASGASFAPPEVAGCAEVAALDHWAANDLAVKMKEARSACVIKKEGFEGTGGQAEWGYVPACDRFWIRYDTSNPETNAQLEEQLCGKLGMPRGIQVEAFTDFIPAREEATLRFSLLIQSAAEALGQTPRNEGRCLSELTSMQRKAEERVEKHAQCILAENSKMKILLISRLGLPLDDSSAYPRIEYQDTREGLLGISLPKKDECGYFGFRLSLMAVPAQGLIDFFLEERVAREASQVIDKVVWRQPSIWA